MSSTASGIKLISKINQTASKFNWKARGLWWRDADALPLLGVAFPQPFVVAVVVGTVKCRTILFVGVQQRSHLRIERYLRYDRLCCGNGGALYTAGAQRAGDRRATWCQGTRLRWFYPGESRSPLRYNFMNWYTSVFEYRGLHPQKASSRPIAVTFIQSERLQ